MSTIGADEVGEVTMDGDEIDEITMDGDVVWKGVEIIDDFEDGNANGWSTQGSGNRSIVFDGLNGTDYAWRHDGFSEVHLSGGNAVDRGPQPGDIFEFWFVISSTSGPVINRFEFSASTFNDDDCYRVEIERDTSDNEFSLEKIAAGSQAAISVDQSWTPSLDFPYRCQVEWNVDGSNNISAVIYTPGGDIVAATNISDNSGGTHAQPGVFFRTNDNNLCTLDELRIID